MMSSRIRDFLEGVIFLLLVVGVLQYLQPGPLEIAEQNSNQFINDNLPEQYRPETVSVSNVSGPPYIEGSTYGQSWQKDGANFSTYVSISGTQNPQVRSSYVEVSVSREDPTASDIRQLANRYYTDLGDIDCRNETNGIKVCSYYSVGEDGATGFSAETFNGKIEMRKCRRTLESQGYSQGTC